MNPVITRRLSQTSDPWEGYTSIQQRLLQQRGISDPKQLDYSLRALLSFHDLHQIDQAASRLAQALTQQECIVIVGDFDADGATSCVVAMTALKAMGAKQVYYCVPNRFDFGYGLTPEIVCFAIEKFQPKLIITVDNGIANHAGVAQATQQGVDVIITDHHLAADTLPTPAIIVNPNQPHCCFASKHLAGVGVIFYVMLALRAHLREQHWFSQRGITEPKLSDCLDVVALGTIADVVPLDHNNRILAYQGLQRIRQGLARPGIYALLQVAKRPYQTLTASDLAFGVAPRLNAAGRLEDMSLGIACLLCDDSIQALQLAEQLNALNQERRLIEYDMKQKAEQALQQCQLEQKKALPCGLSLFHQDWHQGVVGILASRIKEQHHRPTVAFAKVAKDELKGSARSIAGVHIRDVLSDLATQHPSLIIKFGGHAMAAGLSLAEEKFELFSELFAQEVEKHVDSKTLQREFISDGQLNPAEFNLNLARWIRDQGPWGQAFPEPLFDGEFTVLDQRLVAEKHLKLWLRPHNSDLTLDAIAFNVDLDLWPNHHCQRVQAVYRLDVNTYQGLDRLQLIIEYLAP